MIGLIRDLLWSRRPTPVSLPGGGIVVDRRNPLNPEHAEAISTAARRLTTAILTALAEADTTIARMPSGDLYANEHWSGCNSASQTRWPPCNNGMSYSLRIVMHPTDQLPHMAAIYQTMQTAVTGIAWSPPGREGPVGELRGGADSFDICVSRERDGRITIALHGPCMFVTLLTKHNTIGGALRLDILLNATGYLSRGWQPPDPPAPDTTDTG